MNTKHGKYSFEFDPKDRSRWDEEAYPTGIEYTIFDLKLPDVNDIIIECTLVSYEPEPGVWRNPKYINPTYYLDIWWDEEVNCYWTRNFQNLKGTFNRYVKHIEKLIDDNQLNKTTLDAFFKQINEENTARKKLDKEIYAKRDFKKRVRNTFPSAFYGGK